MRLWILFPFVLTLGGCAGSPLHDRLASPEQLAQEDDAYCHSIGLQMGTPNYASCRMTLTQNREQRVENMREGLRAAGAALMEQGQQSRPPPVTTTCQNVGATTFCTTQ